MRGASHEPSYPSRCHQHRPFRQSRVSDEASFRVGSITMADGGKSVVLSPLSLLVMDASALRTVSFYKMPSSFLTSLKGFFA